MTADVVSSYLNMHEEDLKVVKNLFLHENE